MVKMAKEQSNTFPTRNTPREKGIPQSPKKASSLLLLGDTDGAAAATGGLGVLTTDTEAPVMTETTMSADLLETLKIVTELGVDVVGQDLVILTVNDIALTVEEPGGDLVLGGVLDDGDDALELFGGQITSTVTSS